MIEFKVGFVIFSLLLYLYIFYALRAGGFKIIDLVTVNGKASKSSTILMCSFVVTTFYFMFAVLSDKMTETLFLAYAGVWVVPALTKTVKGKPQGEITE